MLGLSQSFLNFFINDKLLNYDTRAKNVPRMKRDRVEEGGSGCDKGSSVVRLVGQNQG